MNNKEIEKAIDNDIKRIANCKHSIELAFIDSRGKWYQCEHCGLIDRLQDLEK
jgi:hypothetical protein